MRQRAASVFSTDNYPLRQRYIQRQAPQPYPALLSDFDRGLEAASRFGIAPTAEAGFDELILAEGIDVFPVRRPADLPAYLGWTGAKAAGLTAADITAVLRNWEDRFGVVINDLRAERLRLEVLGGPRPHGLGPQLAMELLTFAPLAMDALDLSFGELAQAMETNNTWNVSFVAENPPAALVCTPSAPPAASRWHCPYPGTLASLYQRIAEAGFTPRIVSTTKVENIADHVGFFVAAAPGLAEFYQQLIADFPRTGFWPVVPDGMDTGYLLPDFRGPVPPTTEVLTRRFDELFDTEEEGNIEHKTYMGFTQPFPALRQMLIDTNAAVIPNTDVAQPDRFAKVATMAEDKWGILIVPVTRPADVPAAVGWSGALNHALVGGDISAMLRGWEDRFGALLIRLGGPTLGVLTPNRSPSSAETVELTLEQYLFCPDGIEQGFETVERYREMLEFGLDEWDFWWD